MSIGRAIAQYIVANTELTGEEIFPDLVNFVQGQIDGAAEIRHGLAYGIVSDIPQAKYGQPEAMQASVVLDFAMRADGRLKDEERFEIIYSKIQELFKGAKPMKLEATYETMTSTFKVDSMNIADGARILVAVGFMRGYIVVDVSYEKEA